MPPKRKSSSFQWGYWPLLAVVVVCGLILMFQWLKVVAPRIAADFYYPYTAGPVAVKGVWSDQSLALRSSANLAAEVQALRMQNASLSAKAARIGELEAEVRDLRTLNKMAAPQNYLYKLCDVTLRDPVTWEEHFSINVGANDGVMEGAAVLAPIYGNEEFPVALVGIVRKVSRHSSQVFSIMNPELRLSVMLPSADAVGFINSEGVAHSSADVVALGYLPVNRNYALGEWVVTTGIEPLVPQGIPLGKLGDIESVNTLFSNKLYRSGGLRPLADLNVLRRLIVVVPDRKQ